MRKLINPDGRPRFGVFKDPVSDVNVRDYRHRTVTGGPAGPLARWVGFKQFQYFGAISDEIMFGCALAHLRHVAIAFAYAYVPGEGMLVEHSSRAPLGVGVQLATSPVQGHSRFRSVGIDGRLGYEDSPRRKTIALTLGRRLRVQASLDETEVGFEPMSLCTRIGRNGWVYAHKVAGVPLRGTIECHGRRFDLERIAAYGHHDFSAGYMRRETFWNWACFSGRATDGAEVGLNVSCGVNETSFSENCFWIGGQLVPLGLCHFEYDWDNPLRPWRVTSADGALDLGFRAEGQHTERLRLGLVASDFKQIFGVFDGTVRLPDGREVRIERLRGFVEDQYAKW